MSGLGVILIGLVGVDVDVYFNRPAGEVFSCPDLACEIGPAPPQVYSY